MMYYTPDGRIESSFFPKALYAHGFTTKQHGNLHSPNKIEQYLSSMDIDPKTVTQMRQVHKTNVQIIEEDAVGRIIPQTDGLIYSKKNKYAATVVVRVADCVPLLFADKTMQIIGVAHSGWKGTLGHIAQRMIHTFVLLGSDPKNIMVAIGPSICGKCYEVGSDIAQKFDHEFSNGIERRNGRFFIDLRRAILEDLERSGVEKKHVDGDKNFCTYEQDEMFYSYRRKKDQFGEIIGYIGISGI